MITHNLDADLQAMRESLRRARKKTGLTAKEAGLQTGLGFEYVVGMERGKHTDLRISTFVRVASLYRIPPYVILDEMLLADCDPAGRLWDEYCELEAKSEFKPFILFVLSKRLAEKRLAISSAQLELDRNVGMSEGQTNRIERMNRDINISTVFKYAHYFSCSASDLIHPTVYE